ncbi:MAG: hypothetical protein IT453_12675 [Planctomycetes bacterium]|nr:hypothetical protein [Planctomycetota bacterium]
MERRLGTSLLALASLATAATAQTVLVQLHGQQAGSGLGASIAALSDLDGDGVPEVALGTRGEAVHVVSGANGAPRYSVGAGVHYTFGERVRAVGDCDGDGACDFIVPTWQENSYDGVARVYSGASGALLHTFFGTTGARLGRDADGVGDVDGDGRSDFVIGADGEQNSGVARVYSGATGAVIHTIAAAVYGGLDLGAGVGGVGDVDGDAVPDFAVGVPAGVGQGGTVFVFSGASATLLLTIQEPSLSLWTYGRTITSPGDVDGDGASDIAIGDSHTEGYSGSVLVYSGANGGLLYRAFGDGCLGNGTGGFDPAFGTELSAVGDIDLDGVGDLGVGGTNEARVFSGASGALLRVFHEPQYAAAFGSAGICALPDLDGDGVRELVVGWMWAPGDPLHHQYHGRVTWYADDAYPPAGTLLALGDGSGAPCPCGNVGQSGAGCANSTGSGGELRAFGSTSIAQDTVYFDVAKLPPNANALLYCGTLAVNGGLGTPFGAGLRGAGGATKRFHAWKACSDGRFVCGPGLQTMGGWLAGESRVFQVWYRNLGGPCGSSFNFTNAVQVSFLP